MYEDLRQVMIRIDNITNDIRCRGDCNGFCCKPFECEFQPAISPGEKYLIEEYFVNMGEPLPPYRQSPCRFLTEDNRCSIYEARPLQCRKYYCEECGVNIVTKNALDCLCDQYFESHPEEREQSDFLWAINFRG